MKEKSINNEQKRIKAVELWKNKFKINEICKSLKCSRAWLYKWLNRYSNNEATAGGMDFHWYQEQSRKPRTSKGQIDKATETLVIETRKQLMTTPYMQYGPQAIYYTLEMRGITPPPVWSIARILKHNKITRRKKIDTYIPKGKKYPYEYVLSQQMDFAGPRYLYSKTRFYFHTIICCDTHWAQVCAFENQDSANVCNGLIRFWKIAGIPDYLQMDNDLAFWGSLNRPTALGKVVRLCLLHNVTPVFIPKREPWRNGIIEHFNNQMQSAVLNSDRFENIEQVQKAADHFCQIHNQNHHYSSQEGMTPQQRREHLCYPATTLSEDYSLPQERLPLSDGQIHVIRFVRSDLKFNIFGLSFTLPKEAVYEYIKGVIITDKHLLKIFKEQELIAEYDFVLY
ncbi:MAG: integrase core domain-containing protein [Candidatus Aquicultor sp.]